MQHAKMCDTNHIPLATANLALLTHATALLHASGALKEDEDVISSLRGNKEIVKIAV